MSAKVLIVDDSADFCQLLKMTLEFNGYEVTQAANGREALDAVRQDAFGLILCDIDMPIMNGLEFVRRFRDEFGSETPVIVLSAEDDDLMSQALANGASGSIAKPFEPIKLIEAIRQYLS